MNAVELNAILYYADFLSLKEISIPVTDNCKYFFIYGAPMNAAYIVDLQPFYDENNPYYQQAYMEYNALKNKFGEDAVVSFVDDICKLRALGSIDGKQMLQCIHQYSSKSERKSALRRYDRWRNSQKYSHLTINEDGKSVEEQCSRHIAHYEYKTDSKTRIRYIERISIIPSVHKRSKDDDNIVEKDSEVQTL